MAARERHSLTEAAIDSIVDDTPPGYRFIYLDADSPPWLRETLADRAPEWNLEVVHFDEPLWPHEARQRVAPGIDTDYTVFIDNDVQVEAGWLEALVACADETGAGIVGPLYLWGDGIAASKIHMAGGRLIEDAAEGGRVLDEKHDLFNADPRAVQHELVRRPCDFVEFHCMLVRTALMREPDFFDPAIRCAHEHIDVALRCVERGFPVYFEPASRVQYMAFTDYMLDDLGFFRERWSRAEGEASIAAFSRKWSVIDDERSFGGVRSFLRDHLAHVDPLRTDDLRATDLASPLRAEALPQTRSILLDLAIRRGYAAEDVQRFADAFELARRLFDGQYRPCGRPFLCHAIGTAGVLVGFDFAADVVIAAMLHAAYTHAAFANGGEEGNADAVNIAIAGFGSRVERLVRAYTEREREAGLAANDSYADADVLATLSIPEAEVLAIEAANEVDMHLSGEFRYSGRTDEIGPTKVRSIEHVCALLGVDGLSATLKQARGERMPVPEELQTAMRGSHQITQSDKSNV